MIELTVKTLDSQNHQFTVEDDITVEQFKIRIAETVNIPAETQRIIYCGRVLQDNSKLADYDVHGKVVHLVQRPPPNANQRSNSRSSSPELQRRVYRTYRGLEQGNAMYLGSMAFPGNLMESQGIVPPPPTHSLSGSRLNVAKRMLRRAEAVIQLLENPSARSQEQAQSEENQEEEEVTPVIEARVIVPSDNEPIQDVLNELQNNLVNSAGGTITLYTSDEATGERGSQSNTESAQRSPNQSGTSTPGGPTPRSSSTENLSSEPRSENGAALPENASRTSEMAELLTMLRQLQTRFAPFLERYHNFMQEDPEIPADNQRQTQLILNRVSEVMHFLGHAYHSLSDILIRVRTPPPRPLLCRPILIQHSAVVQTGIPIQVEAQINLSADRPPPAGAAQPQNGANTTSPPANATTNTNTNTTPAGAPTISVQSGFVGLPFLPGTAMRVQSFPVEIRTVRPHNIPRPQNNNNLPNATSSSASSGPTSSSGPTQPVPPSNPQEQAQGAQSQGPVQGQGQGQGPAQGQGQGQGPAQGQGQGQGPAQGQGQGQGPAQGQGQGGLFNFHNPNVEFFMEVTPEGITIDSLETTLVGSNEANDLLRGALQRPPPEFLQSLMQMAGQIINRNIPPTTSAPAATTAESTQSSVHATAQPAGQNSQARGNTQTNPTTATSTRSTPRPHVHLAQQAMQGGFDPFLPCNSHHISRRRAPVIPANVTSTTSSQQTATPNATPRQDTPSQAPRVAPQQPNFGNFINGLFDSITQFRRVNEQRPGAGPTQNTATAAASGDNTRAGTPGPTPLASFLSGIQGGENLPGMLHNPTLTYLFNQIQQDDQYVPGENIVTDLIMLFVRNLTLVDVFTLNSGSTEPINRNISEIQNFFRTRICEGNTTQEGINRGAERLISEMQPFLENFSSFPVQNNIDMIRSAEQLFRQRLPEIINIAMNLSPDTVRTLLNLCIATAKQLLALTLYASLNGQQGVEQIYEQLMNRFMQDVPPEIQNWTLMTSRIHLRQILSHLSIPESVIQPYVIYRQESVPVVQNRPNIVNSYAQPEAEAMELDEPEAASSDLGSPTIMLEDTEPLPTVIGSEPWHGQVPEDWVPIITRDVQKQRRQNSQGPFSDAYLSGMPSKRRKIVNNSKPQGSLPQVITDSVRQAVTATGLTSAAPLETVAQLAGSSPEIQTAYRSLLRTTVQANLRDNEDYLPERFPNVSNYFNSEQ